MFGQMTGGGCDRVRGHTTGILGGEWVSADPGHMTRKCVLRDGAGAVLASGVLMRERLRYENNGLFHSHAMQVIVRPTRKPGVGHQQPRPGAIQENSSRYHIR